jgi:hypothetical protein
MYVGLHVKYRYCCEILIKLEFSQQILEKYSNIKFPKIRPVGSKFFHEDGWTDGHDEDNSRFSQVRESA